MSDKHLGLPVAGYRPQNQVAVDTVNENKKAEERILRVIDALRNEQTPDGHSIQVDQRWLSIAATQMEQAFMALNRAIFQPSRIEGEI